MSNVPAAAWLKDYLRGWANQIAARFGYPVYLVGSSLREVDPRDVDVVCVIPDEDFCDRYGCHWAECQLMGPTEKGRKWYADMAKLVRYAMQYHRMFRGRVNLDFKVQSVSWASSRSKEQPRIRIDTVDCDAVLDALPSWEELKSELE